MIEPTVGKKVYRGTRNRHTGPGSHTNYTEVIVTGEDGRVSPLPPRLDVRNVSPDGFEWGYGGSGPCQLAIALLCEHLGDEEVADIWTIPFKSLVIAKLPQKRWEMKSIQVEQFLKICRTDPQNTRFLEAERRLYEERRLDLESILECATEEIL